MTRPLGHCIESTQSRRLCGCARRVSCFLLHTDKETRTHTQTSFRVFVGLCIDDVTYLTAHRQPLVYFIGDFMAIANGKTRYQQNCLSMLMFMCTYTCTVFYGCSAQFENVLKKNIHAICSAMEQKQQHQNDIYDK